MERLNKWITRYLALEMIGVFIMIIICILIWFFSEQLMRPNSWLTLRRNPEGFLYSSLVLACLGNMVGAAATLLVLLRKNRPVITIDNFIGAAINLIAAVIFLPFVLQAVSQLLFASRSIGKY